MKIQFINETAENGFVPRKGIDILTGKIQLRITSNQFALWSNCNPIFNFIRGK